jgi:hypothetical protein
MKLYKYFRPGLMDHAFTEKNEACLKFDYPKNYNDPLELFLTLKGEEVDPQVIAYYKEILGEIPQMPTSCFSKRPDIIPMWAHYGEEHAGFVIEIDEKAIADVIPIGYLADVKYVIDTGVTDWKMIGYAAATLKPRHTYNVQTDAFKNAYFTKNLCWEYEKERRLIIDKDNFKKNDSLMIFKIPAECVTGLISGVRCSDEKQKKLKTLADQFHCTHYSMKIGRSSCIPYFSDGKHRSFLFADTHLALADNVCSQCFEPKKIEGNLCQWCMIDENDQANARMNNPFTMIDELGLREEFKYGLRIGDLKPIGFRLKKPNSLNL